MTDDEWQKRRELAILTTFKTGRSVFADTDRELRYRAGDREPVAGSSVAGHGARATVAGSSAAGHGAREAPVKLAARVRLSRI